MLLIERSFFIFEFMGFLKFVVIVLLANIGGSYLVAAQDPYYKLYNKATGLPSNSIYDIFQDSRGFIWIANDGGLTRFDGFSFKTYTNSQQSTRAGNDIKEDRFGRVWYKNFDGYLFYIEHDSLKSLKQNNTIGNTSYAIMKNTILVNQSNGIDLFDLETLKVVKNVGIDFSKYIGQIQRGDFFYILSDGFLFKIDEKGGVSKYFAPQSGTITASKNGIIVVDWANKDKLCFEIKDGVCSEKMRMPNINFIQGVRRANSLYWFYTPNGTWVFDEDGRIQNGGKPYFASQNISSVYYDREGNTWLGTLDAGVMLVPNMEVKLIQPPGFTANLLSYSGNDLFIGSKDNSIHTYDAVFGKFMALYKGEVRHEVGCMLLLPDIDKIIFNTEKCIVANRSFTNISSCYHSIKEFTPVDSTYCAYASSGIVGLLKLTDKPSIWDSTFRATRSVMPDFCGLFVGIRARTVAYNPINQTLYSGSSKGVNAIKIGSVQELNINGERVYANKIVTYGSKVYLLSNQNRLYVVGNDNVLSPVGSSRSPALPAKLRKAGSNLYVVTKNGIRVLDTLTGSLSDRIIYPGIEIDAINDFEEVGNKLVIASDMGLIEIDRFGKKKDTVKPLFCINSILVKGKPIPDKELANLPHTSNDVDIHYSILSFRPENDYQLYYRINNNSWQQASNTSRNLKLALLSPNDYVLSFRLVSQDGKSVSQPDVRFTIRKPYWAEWWFVAGCFTLVVVSVFSYYRWRTNLLNRQNAMKIEKIELEKNLRNSMLTSIRAQMNPHFFYNALNTIQSFIYADDKRNAATYLVKLSKLTRMILEMSAKESISLDEETDALRLYLELEKMRFDDKFHYEIHIGATLDSDMVRMPPMIVQPYVENAIKHGLLHKKGDCRLVVEFISINGNLCITIDDNGIGREKAAELKQVKTEKHQSFSTDANSRRIALLNKERSKEISIVFIDKKDNDGMPAGTTVIISIPLA